MRSGALLGSHHLTRRHGRLLTGLVAAGLMLTGAAEARAVDSWIVEDLRGTVVRLDGDQWQEVSRGESIGASVVLQSLASSRAILRISDLRLRLGPKTAVEAAVAARVISLDQYSGTIEVVIASTSLLDLAVHTPGLVVSSPGGRLSIEVNGSITEIAVLSGSAEARDTASGRTLVLYDGESTTDLRAEIVEASASSTQWADANGKPSVSSGTTVATPAATVTSAGGDVASSGAISVADGTATSASSSSPNPNAGSNPNSNAGGNQNSNAGGNPNSNAGGNPNANAGGNPNANAGGNPNSNAGGNPNANAGGNPNSNAGGNPNSDAGGNPNANAGGGPNANAGGNPNANSSGNSNASGNPNSNAAGNTNSNADNDDPAAGGDANAGGDDDSNANGNPNSNAGGNNNPGGGKSKNNAKGS